MDPLRKIEGKEKRPPDGSLLKDIWIGKSGEIDDMTGVLVLYTFANTPVVSPESESPDSRGFRYNQIVA